MAKVKLTQKQKNLIIDEIVSEYKEQDLKNSNIYTEKVKSFVDKKLNKLPLLKEYLEYAGYYRKSEIRDFLKQKYKSEFDNIIVPKSKYQEYRAYAEKELEFSELRGNIELDQLISTIKEGIKNLK